MVVKKCEMAVKKNQVTMKKCENCGKKDLAMKYRHGRAKYFSCT